LYCLEAIGTLDGPLQNKALTALMEQLPRPASDLPFVSNQCPNKGWTMNLDVPNLDNGAWTTELTYVFAVVYSQETFSVKRWMFMMERDEKIELIAVLQCCIHCIYRC
jgi:hypothetical protein